MKIKIRAWDKVRKVMIPDLICFYPPKDEENSAKEWRISHSNEFNSSDAPFHGYMWNIHNLIPMLFTGLKDSNGNEIYDGDVCRIGVLPCEEEPEGRIDGITEIWFHEGRFLTRHFGFPVSSWACNDKMFIEVVGNIHQNPELTR